jgi:hypothetical protein
MKHGTDRWADKYFISVYCPENGGVGCAFLVMVVTTVYFIPETQWLGLFFELVRFSA